jgi:hypothetical protein
MKFKNDIEAQAGFKDAGGDLGVAGQLLSSTGTETNWVYASTVIGGPYLPLTAGSTVPLSGDLYLNNATYIRSTDSNGAVPRMFGINPSNSTYIGPIDAYAGGAIFYGVSANVSAQTFYTGASARMHINSTGNVGIGTTSPGYKLDVAGEVRANNLFRTTDGTNIGLFGSSVFASNVIGIGSSNAVPLVLGTAATERMRIDSSGNVGIGTTSPTHLLTLETASSPGLKIKDTTQGATLLAFSQDSNSHVGTFSSHPLVFDTNSTERMRITSAGNVGIGTTSPGSKLEVQGYISSSNNLGSPSSGANINMVYGGGIGYITSYDYNNSVYKPLYLRGSTTVLGLSGNVGIGTTSPTNKLDIRQSTSGGSDVLGTGAITIGSDNPYWTFRGTATSLQDLAFDRSYAGTWYESMRIQRSTGNVGIGTTSPNHKLDIYSNENVPLRIHRPSNANLDSSGAWGIGFSTRGDANTSTTDTRAGIFSYYNGNLFLAAANTSIVADPDAYARLTILNAGSIKFNSYNSTNNTGTPTYLLGTDASGNIVKTNTVPGSAAGPYLPLAGGTLSGDLTMDDSDVVFKHTDGFNYYRVGVGTNANFEIYNTNYGRTDLLITQSTGNATFAGSGTFETTLNVIATDSGGSPAMTAVMNMHGYDQRGVGIKMKDNKTTSGGGTDAEWFVGTGYNSTGFNIGYASDGSRNATFAGTVTAPTFLGDLNGTINTVTTAVTKANSTNDTTVATTAFVQNLIGTIPAGLVFQGTWNAATNTPTLTSGTGTTGNFYIVSVDGSTNLDGITDWKVGDWAVFVEQGASDQWEKVDNSSVLDGSGTGQTVALWSGSGTSNTLTDSIITQTGSSPSQQIRITSENDTQLRLDGGTTSYAGIHWVDVSGNDYMYFNGSSGTFAIGGGGSGVSGKKLHIDGSTSIGSNYDAASPPTNGLVVEGNVGIGTTSPSVPLAVEGVASMGSNSRLSMGILDINSNGTPTQILIQTTIPWNSGSADFTVNIKGFVYGTDESCDLSIHWHYYNSVIYNANCTSSGSWAPIINLHSSSSGFVQIHLSSPGYWPKLYVESMYSSAYNDLYASGWSWSDAAGTGTAYPLDYNKDFGNNFVMTDPGDVGIGTSSPGAKLHVLDNSSANVLAKIRIQGDATSGYGDIGMQSGYIRLFSNGSMCSAWTGGVQYSYINGSTATTLNSTGFGIGTTSPSTKLHVNGDIGAYTSDWVATVSGSRLLMKTFAGTGDTYSLIQAQDVGGNSNNALVLQPYGDNVGIGTTSPAFKLDVNGGSNSTSFRVLSTNTTSLRTFFEATSGNVEQHFLYTGNQDWVLGLDKADSNKFKLASADDAFASAKLTVTTSGNVGIGTTSPSFKLDIAGDGIRNIRSTAGWAGWFENTGNSSGVVVTAGVDSGDAPLLISKQGGTELFSDIEDKGNFLVQCRHTSGSEPLGRTRKSWFCNWRYC